MAIKMDECVIDLLADEVGYDLASSYVSFRKARGTVKPFDTYRAKKFLKKIQEAKSPADAVWEELNREKNSVELSHEYLLKCMEYDADTGLFNRLVPPFHGLEWPSLGSLASNGYRVIPLCLRRYLAHRLAWFYVHGKWPSILDHIDRDRSNNRISNLRECSVLENAWNQSVNSRNRSGFKGVHFDKKSGKWVATMQIDGKTRYLGNFSTPEEASERYSTIADQFRGDFLRRTA